MLSQPVLERAPFAPRFRMVLIPRIEHYPMLIGNWMGFGHVVALPMLGLTIYDCIYVRFGYVGSFEMRDTPSAPDLRQERPRTWPDRVDPFTPNA